MGFVKIDSGILDSSLWSESAITRVVFITFTTKCNRDGFVSSSYSGMLRAANVPKEDFDKAIKILESPDADSKDPANEGRRIQKVDGGWMVLNYTKYREYDYSDSPDAIRMREKRAKERDEHIRTCSNNSEHVRTIDEHSASASVSSFSSGINTPEEKTIIYSLPFSAFWSLYPRKVGKDAAWRAWQKLKLTQEDCTVIAAALEWQKKSEQWTREGGQYIPHPSTYLNAGRWKDEQPGVGVEAPVDRVLELRKKYGIK